MPDLRQLLAYLALISQLGLTMVVCIYLGFRLGVGADGYFGTKMLFTAVGSLLGTATGFVAIYRLVLRAMRDTEE